jgi:SOS-response transcriptional repressor LexA
MTKTYKSIPIVSAELVASNEPEIRSCAEAEPYALRVVGDSMSPEFAEGHVIIVDPALPPQSGSYVVIDYAGETTFRQYSVDEAGKKFLVALNPAYAVIPLEGAYTVRGVVIQRAGRRRRDHKNYY